MRAFEGLSTCAQLPGNSSFAPLGASNQPSSVVDGPRVTVTGHRTDSFSGVDGVMFQAMFEMPFGAGLRTDGNHDHEQPIGPDDPVPPVAVNAELVVQTSDFYQSLPAEAQQALMSSPTLVNQVATFLLSGGTIEFGEVPAGAMGIFQAAHGTEDAFIRIGDQILDSLNTGSTYRLEQFLGTLAHELGHAMTTMEGFDFDVSSRQAYIDSGFASEAYAVLNAMLVMHEITNAGNVVVLPMMVMTGGNANGVYEDLYSQFAQDADLDALLGAIADHMRSLPGNPYGQYYGEVWDNEYGDD